MSELETLPEGWSMGTIPDLISDGIFTDGDWVESKDQDPGGSIRLLQLADIGDGYFVDKSSRYMNPQTAANLNCTFLQKNDVLVARMPDPLGRACLMPTIEQNAVTVVDVCVIRDKPQNFDSRWLMYFINSPDFRNEIASLQSGSTRKRISRGNLSKIRFPIPPRDEQTRIVEKLEELLSDLDNGVAELKAAQIKLTQYRQSLLKSAVEGSLTAEWRTKNQPSESGQQLLQRILTERRQRWEQQKRDEFKQKNQKPPKDWQLNYPEPVQPDISELPELPEGWVWASLDMLGDIAAGVTKGTKRKTPVEVFETPYLRVANVQRGYLDLSEIKTIPATQSEIENYTLKKGDILFNEGGDRDKLGRGWVWYGEVEKCIHQNHVFRLRLYVTEVIPELISHYGNTFGKLWFQNAGKQTTNLASINKGILQSFPVPLSPIAEQTLIMDLLTTEVDKIDRQILAVDVGLKETDAQRKNILKEAFSGKLVPQDPSDEPASVLLEKIKAERTVQSKRPKPKQTKKKANNKASLMDTLFDILKANGDWMDAQEAFKACGVTDGTDTDRIEELYAELRRLDKAQKLLTKRSGNYDLLKLKEA